MLVSICTHFCHPVIKGPYFGGNGLACDVSGLYLVAYHLYVIGHPRLYPLVNGIGRHISRFIQHRYFFAASREGLMNLSATMRGKFRWFTLMVG